MLRATRRRHGTAGQAAAPREHNCFPVAFHSGELKRVHYPHLDSASSSQLLYLWNPSLVNPFIFIFLLSVPALKGWLIRKSHFTLPLFWFQLLLCDRSEEWMRNSQQGFLAIMCYAVPYPLPFPRTILKRLPAFSIDVLLSPRRGPGPKLYFNTKNWQRTEVTMQFSSPKENCMYFWC